MQKFASGVYACRVRDSVEQVMVIRGHSSYWNTAIILPHILSAIFTQPDSPVTNFTDSSLKQAFILTTQNEANSSLSATSRALVSLSPTAKEHQFYWSGSHGLRDGL